MSEKGFTISKSEVELLELLRKDEINSKDRFMEYVGVITDEVQKDTLNKINEDLDKQGFGPVDEDEEDDEDDFDEDDEDRRLEKDEDEDEDDDDYDEVAQKTSVKDDPYVRQLEKTLKKTVKRLEKMESGHKEGQVAYSKDQFKGQVLKFIESNGKDYKRIANVLKNESSPHSKYLVDILFKMKGDMEEDSDKEVSVKMVCKAQEENLKRLEYDMTGQKYVPPAKEGVELKVLPREEGSDKQFSQESQDVVLDGNSERTGKSGKESFKPEDMADPDKMEKMMDNSIKEALNMSAG